VFPPSVIWVMARPHAEAATNLAAAGEVRWQSVATSMNLLLDGEARVTEGSAECKRLGDNFFAPASVVEKVDYVSSLTTSAFAVLAERAPALRRRIFSPSRLR
jgi:hypothetical protein